MSANPFEVKLDVPEPGSKSHMPAKYPETYTLFPASDDTENPPSPELSPNLCIHIRFPELSSCTKKISLKPLPMMFCTPGPGSKSVVSEKFPVTHTFPEGVTLTERPSS